MSFPNEIEKTKAEIKVLEAKLSLLEELKKQKSPVEIAFKDSYGVYPDELKTTDDFNCWNSFRRGYIAAKQEKVGEYQPTPQTPEQVAQGLRDAMKQAKAQGVFDEPEPETLTLKQLLKKWEIDFAANWAIPKNTASELYEEEVERFIQMFMEWMPDAIVTDIGRSELWNGGYNAYRKILMGKLK